MKLTSKQIQALRALAHPLKPLVQVGNKGLTDAVLQQISDQLTAHELIKVRWNTESGGEPDEGIGAVEQATKSILVQHTGRILTLYRRHDTKPKITLPRPGKGKTAPKDEADLS